MTMQASKNAPKTGEKTRRARAGSTNVTEARALSPRHFCENGRMKKKWKTGSNKVHGVEMERERLNRIWRKTRKKEGKGGSE
ncbi:MAG: hypothetical protein NVSMB27_30430 [Ktedonobacteraceae bacterium]